MKGSMCGINFCSMSKDAAIIIMKKIDLIGKRRSKSIAAINL